MDCTKACPPDLDGVKNPLTLRNRGDALYDAVEAEVLTDAARHYAIMFKVDDSNLLKVEGKPRFQRTVDGLRDGFRNMVCRWYTDNATWEKLVEQHGPDGVAAPATGAAGTKVAASAFMALHLDLPPGKGGGEDGGEDEEDGNEGDDDEGDDQDEESVVDWDFIEIIEQDMERPGVFSYGLECYASALNTAIAKWVDADEDGESTSTIPKDGKRKVNARGRSKGKGKSKGKSKIKGKSGGKGKGEGKSRRRDADESRDDVPEESFTVEERDSIYWLNLEKTREPPADGDDWNDWKLQSPMGFHAHYASTRTPPKSSNGWVEATFLRLVTQNRERAFPGLLTPEVSENFTIYSHESGGGGDCFFYSVAFLLNRLVDECNLQPGLLTRLKGWKGEGRGPPYTKHGGFDMQGMRIYVAQQASKFPVKVLQLFKETYPSDLETTYAWAHTLLTKRQKIVERGQKGHKALAKFDEALPKAVAKEFKRTGDTCQGDAVSIRLLIDSPLFQYLSLGIFPIYAHGVISCPEAFKPEKTRRRYVMMWNELGTHWTAAGFKVRGEAKDDDDGGADGYDDMVGQLPTHTRGSPCAHTQNEPNVRVGFMDGRFVPDVLNTIIGIDCAEGNKAARNDSPPCDLEKCAALTSPYAHEDDIWMPDSLFDPKPVPSLRAVTPDNLVPLRNFSTGANTLRPALLEGPGRTLEGTQGNTWLSAANMNTYLQALSKANPAEGIRFNYPSGRIKTEGFRPRDYLLQVCDVDREGNIANWSGERGEWKHFVVIVNIADSGSKGTHWVLIYVGRDNGKSILEYYDSMSNERPPRTSPHGATLFRFEQWYTDGVFGIPENDRAMTYRADAGPPQKGTSQCGMYALWFAQQRIEGRTMDELQEHVPSDDECITLRSQFFAIQNMSSTPLEQSAPTSGRRTRSTSPQSVARASDDDEEDGEVLSLLKRVVDGHPELKIRTVYIPDPDDDLDDHVLGSDDECDLDMETDHYDRGSWEHLIILHNLDTHKDDDDDPVLTKAHWVVTYFHRKSDKDPPSLEYYDNMSAKAGKYVTQDSVWNFMTTAWYRGEIAIPIHGHTDPRIYVPDTRSMPTIENSGISALWFISERLSGTSFDELEKHVLSAEDLTKVNDEY